MSIGVWCVKRPSSPYLDFCSAINLFSYSRPFTKGSLGEETPHFRDVWTEKTYLTTEETFPTVLRRSEVIELQVVEISALESALLDVETRNKELAALETKYSALAKTQANVSATALAMALNAAVDTPPDAGIPVYRDAFFRAEYLARYPEVESQLQKLKAAIDEQVRSRLMLCSPPQVLTIFADQTHRSLPEAPRRAMRTGDDVLPRDTHALLQNQLP